jgi:hypothetical protein
MRVEKLMSTGCWEYEKLSLSTCRMVGVVVEFSMTYPFLFFIRAAIVKIPAAASIRAKETLK